MICLIACGNCWSRVCLDEKAPGEERRETTGNSSMRFFWMLRTGAPWRDLPPDYGDGKNTHLRFCRWRNRGGWEGLLEALITEPDFEWLMIDASHIKAHAHAAGARGGNQDIGRTKGGSTPRYIWPWMRMVCRSEFLLHPVPLQMARRRAN